MKVSKSFNWSVAFGRYVLKYVQLAWCPQSAPWSICKRWSWSFWSLLLCYLLTKVSRHLSCFWKWSEDLKPFRCLHSLSSNQAMRSEQSRQVCTWGNSSLQTFPGVTASSLFLPLFLSIWVVSLCCTMSRCFHSVSDPSWETLWKDIVILVSTAEVLILE